MASYASIDDPSAHFQAQLYTGNGGTQSITNTGNSDLQPDWVWLKRRDGNDNHSLFDSNRGVTKELNTNGNGAEGTASNLITSFDSDGFGLGDNGGVNGNGESYVAWQWKANGGTTTSNSDGDITSTVQANTTAGFSILTFTTDGNTRSVGHGLGGTPDVIITKVRSGAGNWIDEEGGIHSGLELQTGLIVTKYISEIDFKFPVIQGDVVEIGMQTVEIGKTSCTLTCEVRSLQAGKVVCSIDKMVYVRVNKYGLPKSHGGINE